MERVTEQICRWISENRISLEQEEEGVRVKLTVESAYDKGVIAV